MGVNMLLHNRAQTIRIQKRHLQREVYLLKGLISS